VEPVRRDAFVAPHPPMVADGGYRNINLAAAETSLQAVAVRSCVDLICSLGSELPIDVFSGVGNDRRPRPVPGYLQDPAGDGNGLEDWCYQVLMSWLLRGNLYGDILERSPTGRPIQVDLHYPDDVSGFMEDGRVQWLVNGREVDPAKFLHVRVNPVPGRVQGLSPIEFHSGTIGQAIISTRFGVQWFQDGAHPTGILSNTEVDLNETQAFTAKQRFMAAIRSGGREPLVYGKGWKFDALRITAEESQFLETQGYSSAECCRIFGPGFAEILGYETGGSMTYANIESRSAHLLVYSMNKWLRRLERLLSGMLPAPQYVRIDRDAVLQSTTLERYKAHELALKNQWKVVNEVREDEDMAPVPWGDKPSQPPAPAQAEPEEPTGAEAPVPGGNQ
jgi:HK97 family phage portal protein